MLKPHDLRHGVALEVLEQHHDLEQVRALLGHARLDTHDDPAAAAQARGGLLRGAGAADSRQGVTRRGGGFEKLWNVSRTRGSKH